MDELLAALHPPGWTIWQIIGTGAVLTIGYALGKMVMDLAANLVARARK